MKWTMFGYYVTIGAMVDKQASDKIALLEAEIERLKFDLDKLGHSFVDHLEQFGEVLEAQTDTFARLKTIERKIFPNLMSDLAQVQNAIGPYDETSPNPLDQRKR